MGRKDFISHTETACSLAHDRVMLVVKNLPTSARNVRHSGSILGQRDPLQEDGQTHSSGLAWSIPWTEEPGGLQSMGTQRAGSSRATEHISLKALFSVTVALGSWMARPSIYEFGEDTILYITFSKESI